MTTLYPPSYAAEFNGEGLYRPSLHEEVVAGIVGGIAGAFIGGGIGDAIGDEISSWF
jgi:hypothetical protein